MIDFAAAREAMVERTIRRRGIDDPALLAAFRTVPREEFISRDFSTTGACFLADFASSSTLAVCGISMGAAGGACARCESSPALTTCAAAVRQSATPNM